MTDLHSCSYYCDRPECIKAQRDELRERLAQPEQEPKAWIHNIIEGNVIAHRPIDIDRHPERWTALYPEPKRCDTPPPPRREWVGLTDEEKEKFVVAYYPSSWDRKTAVVLMNNYEAYLKEKNHG